MALDERLDPQIAGLLQMLADAGRPPMSEGTPDLARAGFRTLFVDMRDPASVVEVESVTPATVADRPARVYRPAGSGPKPTILFLHGGGFVIGDLDTHDNVCRRLARDVDAVVVSLDYPLAPEHPYPEAVEACYAALVFVAEHIDEFGGEASKLVVGGDSAGGNLSAVCAQLARRDDLPVAAQLLVYPATDLLGDYPSRHENAEGYFLTLDDATWFAAQYLDLADGDPRLGELGTDPLVSPLQADSLADLPPAVVATAQFDPLRDEGNAYAAALREAGVRVEHAQFDGLIHGFYGMEAFSEGAAKATEWINSELRKLLQ